MSLVHTFMEEVEFIQDEKIRDFVVEALALAPEWYESNHDANKTTKVALDYSKVFLNVLDADDYISDIVTSAILLQDLTRFYHEEADDEEEYTHSIKEDPMHPLSVRQKLLPLMGLVGVDTFDDILRTIESGHGYNSPIPQVMPTMTDPVYMWILPFVNGLAKERA